MRLTIFGATGRTGRHLVEEALTAGYEVIAFVRNPAKLTTKHEHLTVVKGDATDPAAVEQAVHGADAVISVMATQRRPKNKPLTRGTQNILAAMEKYGVRRLVMSASAIPDPHDSPNLRFKLLRGFVRLLARAAYQDTVGSVQVVRASGVDWTVVRMPAPTNAPMTCQVNAEYVNNKVGMRISRADAAAFMLSEVHESKYLRQAPVIWSRGNGE